MLPQFRKETTVAWTMIATNDQILEENFSMRNSVWEDNQFSFSVNEAVTFFFLLC